MITVKTEKAGFILNPTIFPDKTSQVWKLPEEILSSKEFLITWNFEEEREIMDLYSLCSLLPPFSRVLLHMPYLPYGRKDKVTSNDATFNLYPFSDLINNLGFDQVTTVDAHNPAKFERIFRQSRNMMPYHAQLKAVEAFRPTFFVFPDKGAMERYHTSFTMMLKPDSCIYFEKVRDQLTGNITGLTMQANKLFYSRDRLLIIDDICDGGATFIGVAKELRKLVPDVEIALFVTHGIFSRGRQHLLDNGIDEIYTTNSLLANKDGFEV